MAARKRPKKPSGSPRERLITAALELASERGWRRLGMAEIADAAGLSLQETYAIARSKPAILAVLRRQIDEAMLAGGVVTGDSPRDRLFDVLMRRLEAMRPYRAGLRAVLRGSVGTSALLGLVPGLLRSMGWALSAAGVPASGCRGRAARQVLGATYVSVLPTFFADESGDLGTTMAALDRRLRQVEALFSTLMPIVSGGRRRASA
jgi:AcrR family transcriptional regulator